MSVRPALRIPLQTVARQVLPAQKQSRCPYTRRPQPLGQPKTRPQFHCLHQQRRNATTASSGARALFRKHPFSVTIAAATILFGAGVLTYVNYVYQKYIIEAYHNYPEPVAKKLRRAIYFTKTDVQPKEALKYYRQALQVAEEVGMDPFSDEVMGVKIQVAGLMEEVQQYGKAIQVLEILRTDTLDWLKQYGNLEHNKQKRTRLLAKTVAISVKLGELYSSPEIYNRDAAEERLVWAVETVLKEKQRRINEKATDDSDGTWISDAELGGSLEALAHSYEAKSQHYLATPLFLQALSLHPHKTCHQVVLMNNLASSLAQQSPNAARAAQQYATSKEIENAPVGPPATRQTMVDNATTWAQKALDVAAGIRPPERNEECDLGCAVATHNLGEFAEMNGDFASARKRYDESISLARAIGFQEGVEQSSGRLRKLKAAG